MIFQFEHSNLKILRKVRIFGENPGAESHQISTDADISTDATVGWTKNTQKPKKKEEKKGKSNPKRKNSKTSRDMPKFAIYPSTRGL